MDVQMSPNVFSNQLKSETWKRTLLFSFQSLGVLFGQLSSAPLYVFGTIPPKDFISEEIPYGLFSFIFWTFTIISLLKYALIVLGADDDGEGGTFALYSILCRHANVGLLPNESTSYEAESPFEAKTESRARRAIAKRKSSHYLMLFLALFGACMAIADGVLNPALSVLSASSGFGRSLADITFSSSESKQKAVSKALKQYIPVPSACAMLVCLFTLQHYGTHKIGFIFAPIIIIWLLFISGVGVYNIFHWNPRIFRAILPSYMYKFVVNTRVNGWRSLGSIILCVAGSEAMFAGLGHFSKKSIKITFLCLIYPVLVICYAGQAAYISKNIHHNDFNHLTDAVPGRFRHFFVALSLLASFVGSQATITTSFSIINQCIALGCFPRVKVIHTSEKIHGQVYIPDINWLLMVLSVAVTIGFHDIAKIASASGLAVVSGMLVTTCLMSLVIALYWEKNLSEPVCFLVFFGFIEALFVSACMLNIHKGAWSLIVLFAASFTATLSWHYGTMKKLEFDIHNRVSPERLTEELGASRVPGIGFVFTDLINGIPVFFSHFVTNLPALHRVLIFVSFKSLPLPHVGFDRKYLIGRIGPREAMMYRCVVRHGYRDNVRDTDDFEDQILRSIVEFVSIEEERDIESLASPEGRMVVIGKPSPEANMMNNDKNKNKNKKKKKKRVRFLLPRESPRMAREEVRELVEARESGIAYFVGQCQVAVARGGGSGLAKRLFVAVYGFCDKNCRASAVALDVPHAALVEVGMVYNI